MTGRLRSARVTTIASSLTRSGRSLLDPVHAGTASRAPRGPADLLCLGASGVAACVENRRWTVGGVTYATLNVQGTCNNLCDRRPDSATPTGRIVARNTANIAWLQGTFDEAQSRRSAAVMFITQADPGWDKSERRGRPRGTRFRSLRTMRRRRRMGSMTSRRAAGPDHRVQRPVAYVHGDRIISGSTGRSSIRPAGGSRTSRGSKHSATTRRTATTTRTGSRCSSIPIAATCSPINPRSSRRSRTAVPAP